MKRLLFVILFFILCSAGYSQKAWTLQECIDYALKNNILIKQQRITGQVASLTLLQSKAAFLPSVNAAGSHAYNYGKTIDMYTNQFASSTVQSDNFYLVSSVTLFNGFQLLNTLKQSKTDLESDRYDLDKLINDISLNIATAYLQILYNKEILYSAAEQLKISEQQVTRTKKLVEVGTAAKGTLLTLEAQAATEELSVVNAQNALDLSLLTLAQMLDLTNADSFDIAIPEISSPESSALLTSPEAIYSFALGVQPEIKSAELKLKSSELGLSIARGMRYPNLSLRASYGTGFSGASKQISGNPLYSHLDTIGYTFDTYTPVIVPAFDYNLETIPFGTQINDNINKSISFSLNIPIFNGWQVNSATGKAKLAIQNAELNLQTARNTLYKTIQQAYADAAAALKKYAASKKSKEALAEAFKYAEQKFEVGMMNITDYNDSKNKLAAAESSLLQSKYEYVFRLKILDFYMGKPIELK